VKKAKKTKENKTNKPVKHLKANVSTQRSFEDYEEDEDEYEDEFISKESKKTHTIINKNRGTKKEKYFKEVLNKKGKNDNFFYNNDSSKGDINPLKYFKKSFQKIQEEKFVFEDEDEEEEEEEEEEEDKKCKAKKIVKIVKEKVVPKKVKKNGVLEIIDSDSDDFYEKYGGFKNKNIIASNKKVKTKKIIYYDNLSDDEDESEDEKKVKKTIKNNAKNYQTKVKRVKKKIVEKDDDEDEESGDNEKENKKTIVKRKYKTHK
jgi:hypothetical protein